MPGSGFGIDSDSGSAVRKGEWQVKESENSDRKELGDHEIPRPGPHQVEQARRVRFAHDEHVVAAQPVVDSEKDEHVYV